MTRRKILAVAAACASPIWARSRWDRSRISAITDELGRTPEDAAAFARQFRLQAVELRKQPGSSKEYAGLREADIKADAAHLVNQGVKVSCVNTSLLRFTWPDGEGAPAADQARWDRRLDDVRKALRCAQIMGADKVRIFGGLRVAEPSTALARLADTLGEMALIAEKEKIFLLVENDAGTNLATCAELAAVLKLAPSKWLAIDWSPSPSGGLETAFPDGYALLPKKRILNVRAQASGLMPGSAGTEDWKAILLALDHDGYAGRITLETGGAPADTAMDQLVRIVREVS